MNATVLMNGSVFTSFERSAQGKPKTERLVSFLAAGALVVGLGTALWSGAMPKALPKEKPVEITFVPEPVVEAPKPEQTARPKPAAAAAPVVPKHLKKVIVETPPPAKPLEAPTEGPQAPLAEADPSQDKGVMVAGGDAAGDPAGLEGGSAQGKAGGVVGGDVKSTAVAVDVPENAVPPRPFDDNAIPEYPAAAKAAGATGMVVLKVIIDEDGRVVQVIKMRGDEPFVTSAITAVKTWRYQPATQGGKPLRVFRLVKIPFQLNH